MTNEQILEKAIEKARKNGWMVGDYSFATQLALSDYPKDQRSQYFIIFSHSFAKAFWGEEMVCSHYRDRKEIELDYYGEMCKKHFSPYTRILPKWQIHLEYMVLEPEPLKYLEKFLKEV